MKECLWLLKYAQCRRTISFEIFNIYSGDDPYLTSSQAQCWALQAKQEAKDDLFFTFAIDRLAQLLTYNK